MQDNTRLAFDVKDVKEVYFLPTNVDAGSGKHIERTFDTQCMQAACD